MNEIWMARPYQHHMHDFAVDTDSGIALWADMGLGKTATTGRIINTFLFDRFSHRKVLIVGPKRVAYKAWPDEIKRWEHMADWNYRLLTAEDFGLTPAYRERDHFDEATGEIKTGLAKAGLVFGYDEADPRGAQRRAKAETKKRLRTYRELIHIVSWDFLYFLVQAHGDNWPYDLVVLDESSFVKNQDTARFRACRLMAKQTKKIIELTGTPSTRGLLDLWSQAYLLDGGKRLGRTYTGYREAYFSPDKVGYVAGGRMRVLSYKADADAKQSIYAALSDIAISLKAEDYLSLPPLIENRIAVELPKAARELYDKVETDLFAQLKAGRIEAVNPAALFGKLLQIANGTVYDTEKKAHKVHEAKLEALADIAEATPGNLLVAYAFKPEVQALLKRFPKRARIIHSDADIDDWNAGRIPMGVIHPASGGHGLNMQYGGSNVVWFGPPANLEHWLQLNKRLHRSGQTADCVIVSVLTAENTLDDYVRNILLGSKDAEQDTLMDAVRLRMKETAK